MTNVDELRDLADELTNEETKYFEADGSGEPPVELPEKPTVEELKAALSYVQSMTGLALQSACAELERLSKDMDKLRNHRHDNSKQFGGRPEF